MLDRRTITVLHVSPSYKPAYCYGGPTRSISKLCEASNMGKVELNALVFTTTANGDQELDFEAGIEQQIDGVQVYYFSRITKDHTHFSPTLIFALHRYFLKARQTKQQLVVHIHSWWNLVAILAAALAMLHGRPVIISPRGMITPYTLSFRHKAAKYLIHAVLGRWILKNAILHATTALEAKNLGLYLPKASITVIPNLVTYENIQFPILNSTIRNQPIPANVDHSANIQTQRSQQLKLLFLSRIDPKKGLEILFEALAISSLSLTLTIAGTGTPAYLRTLKELSAKLNLTSNINWVGLVEDAEKYELLMSNDLLMLNSSNENFGNVVLESLSVGTPVLLSNQVGLADYVEEKDLGWVCENNAEEISRTLSVINLDSNKRSRIRLMAPRQIDRDFSTANIMNKYVDLYQNVLSHYK